MPAFIRTAAQNHGHNINELYINHEDTNDRRISFNKMSNNFDKALASTEPQQNAPLLSRYILLLTNNNNQQNLNLQSLLLHIKNKISNNVLGAITVISKLTALDLLNCDFNSNKLHEILNIVKRQSDNSAITSETSTRITILIRASSSLLAKSKLSLIGNSRLDDDILLTVSKIKSLVGLAIEGENGNNEVFKAFIQNVAQSTVLENFEIISPKMGYEQENYTSVFSIEYK
ncbi:hypothetical protein BDC45DRAFT_565377 [Circinella umbellata]|nr:hypothetical protein BDC45DRAFT_565377 [Circinella umbellata]